MNELTETDPKGEAFRAQKPRIRAYIDDEGRLVLPSGEDAQSDEPTEEGTNRPEEMNSGLDLDDLVSNPDKLLDASVLSLIAEPGALISTAHSQEEMDRVATIETMMTRDVLAPEQAVLMQEKAVKKWINDLSGELHFLKNNYHELIDRIQQPDRAYKI